MVAALGLTNDARTTAGVLLLSLVAVEWGGTAVLRVARGRVPATPFQEKFARAGHAHAAVLVVLALVCQLYADAAHLSGWADIVARDGVPAAAILFPLGFFLSSAGSARTEPNRLIALLWAGAVTMAAGVVTLGIGLLAA